MPSLRDRVATTYKALAFISTCGFIYAAGDGALRADMAPQDNWSLLWLILKWTANAGGLYISVLGGTALPLGILNGFCNNKLDWLFSWHPYTAAILLSFLTHAHFTHVHCAHDQPRSICHNLDKRRCVLPFCDDV